MINTLGAKILEQLHLSGKNQKDLAKEIDITETTLSRYIAGSRTPSAPTVYKIAKTLGVTTDYLLGETENEGTFDEELVRTRAWIARNVENMTTEQKFALVKAIVN